MKNRKVYLKDLPTAVKLKKYIEELDAKYGTNSYRDVHNFKSFGYIDLDKTILQIGLDNTLYLAHTVNSTSWRKTEPFDIEKNELNKLNKLRLDFKNECIKYKPTEPTYDWKDPKFKIKGKRLNNDEIKIRDDILIEQGFAPSSRSFNKQIRVPRKEKGFYGIFEVEYGRCGNNFAPDFSTRFATCDSCGQAQEEMDHNSLAYKFYKKWDAFHIRCLSQDEYDEMLKDLSKIFENKN